MKNLLLVLGLLVLKVTGLVIAGLGIGFGFWLCRKITERLDRWWDRRKVQNTEKKLKQENPEAYARYQEEIESFAAAVSSE